MKLMKKGLKKSREYKILIIPIYLLSEDFLLQSHATLQHPRYEQRRSEGWL